jgi:predicted N-acetyltransferase YhbS
MQSRENANMKIIPQGPIHGAAIERLLDLTFGHDRHKKTVYRLREAAPAVSSLSFVIERDGAVVATLRFWPVTLPNHAQALLLGPLAVLPELSGQGMGRALVRHGMAQAKAQNWPAVLVVGEPAYYEPFGFSREKAEHLRLPGWVELPRFQAAELVLGALEGVEGLVNPGRPARPAWARKAGA